MVRGSLDGASSPDHPLSLLRWTPHCYGEPCYSRHGVIRLGLRSSFYLSGGRIALAGGGGKNTLPSSSSKDAPVTAGQMGRFPPREGELGSQGEGGGQPVLGRSAALIRTPSVRAGQQAMVADFHTIHASNEHPVPPCRHCPPSLFSNLLSLSKQISFSCPFVPPSVEHRSLTCASPAEK